MAQWEGQFSGYTHDTKVQDAELSLRLAIQTFATAPETERSVKTKAIRLLSERLLAVSLKALRARIAALTDPGRKTVLDEKHVSQLRSREQPLQGHTIDVILKEFNFFAKTAP